MIVEIVGTTLESTDDAINRSGQDSLHKLLKNE
jgi:flavin-binding protein dodecin